MDTHFISDNEYKSILCAISSIGKNLERYPNTHKGKTEETIRDLFLTQLSTTFMSYSSVGEAFNHKGKTDIMVKKGNDIIFIAECKIWKGAKGLVDAVSQLLSYLTWRDTKTALLIFNRNVEMTTVLQSIENALPQIPNYISGKQSDETTFNCVFHFNNDKNRRIKMAIMVFDFKVDFCIDSKEKILIDEFFNTSSKHLPKKNYNKHTNKGGFYSNRTPLAVSTGILTLAVNTTEQITITSGVGYFLVKNSDPSKIETIVKGNIITITALKEGTSLITVIDTQTHYQTKIAAVVVTGMHNGHAYIDLGLPSGTKWASFNINAVTCEDYGDSFAWGETEIKKEYDWGNYKWCEGTARNQTKYCTDSNYGKVDNKLMLDYGDDVAHVKWGGNWRMPTEEDFEELLSKENSTCEWTTLNGVNGYNISGPNGNSIFLPATGCRYISDSYGDGIYGHYWSSTLEKIAPRSARGVCFCRKYIRTYYLNRLTGRSIRPVFQN